MAAVLPRQTARHSSSAKAGSHCASALSVIKLSSVFTCKTPAGPYRTNGGGSWGFTTNSNVYLNSADVFLGNGLQNDSVGREATQRAACPSIRTAAA